MLVLEKRQHRGIVRRAGGEPEIFVSLVRAELHIPVLINVEDFLLRRRDDQLVVPVVDR